MLFLHNQGVISNEGAPWKEQRSFSVHHLKLSGLKGNKLEELTLEEARDLVDTIRNKCSSNEVIKTVSIISVIVGKEKKSFCSRTKYEKYTEK